MKKCDRFNEFGALKILFKSRSPKISLLLLKTSP
jgi:hypothetical protein